MSKRTLTTTTLLFVIAALFAFSQAATAQPSGVRLAQSGGLPDIRFLGEGPGTFTTDGPGRVLLVKTYESGVFTFVAHPEESYEAARNERVWSTDYVPEGSIRLFDEWRSFGQYQAGCTVYYVQIEDNIDERRNSFYIGETLLQTVEQGWVTYGSLVVPSDGELRFFAEDSIGLVVTSCQMQQTEEPTPVQSETPVETPTTPATEEPTVTVPAPTATATGSVPGGEVTPTGTVEATPIGTEPPTATVPPTEEPTEEPTDQPTTAPTTVVTTQPTQGTAIVPGGNVTPTITGSVPGTTATANPTPGQIPVSGGGPGPDQIAWMAAGLLASLAAAATAWWRMVRGSRRGG